MAVPYYSAVPEPTLSKAVVRAAEFLGINQSELAQVLGLSRATVSRLVSGRYQLEPRRAKEWELALLFVRLFRSLDAVVGHGEDARTWLRGANTTLDRAPAEVILTAEGLVRVVHYLDAIRGRV